LGYEYVNLDAGWGTKQGDPKTNQLVPYGHFPGLAVTAASQAIFEKKAMRFGIYGDEGTELFAGALQGIWATRS
jgi:hypothetical protein